jgi:fructoselysine-6-phosphate deglycase
VENFVRRYTEKLTVIDTADYELPGIDGSLRPYLGPIVLATLLERLSAHLEQKRAHPLTTRRYYKRVDY